MVLTGKTRPSVRIDFPEITHDVYHPMAGLLNKYRPALCRCLVEESKSCGGHSQLRE
jgi:hypothetical protein